MSTVVTLQFNLNEWLCRAKVEGTCSFMQMVGQCTQFNYRTEVCVLVFTMRIDITASSFHADDVTIKMKAGHSSETRRSRS